MKRKLEREEVGNERVVIDLEKDQELVNRNGKEKENKIKKKDNEEKEKESDHSEESGDDDDDELYGDDSDEELHISKV